MSLITETYLEGLDAYSSATVTYPQFPDRPRRLGAEVPPFPIIYICDSHVVVPRVGRLPDPGMLHEPRKVLPVQSTEDAIGLPVVGTSRQNQPVPTKVFKIKY